TSRKHWRLLSENPWLRIFGWYGKLFSLVGFLSFQHHSVMSETVQPCGFAKFYSLTAQVFEGLIPSRVSRIVSFTSGGCMGPYRSCTICGHCPSCLYFLIRRPVRQTQFRADNKSGEFINEQNRTHRTHCHQC